MNALDSIEELAQDWVRHLRATNRSPRTIDMYRSAAESLAEYLREQGASLSASEIGRRELELYVSHLMTRPHKRKPGQTVSTSYVSRHYRALQQFFR